MYRTGMKSKTTPTADICLRAREVLAAWNTTKSVEKIAGDIGCSVTSVCRWLAGKHMTRMSAKAILATNGEKVS